MAGSVACAPTAVPVGSSPSSAGFRVSSCRYRGPRGGNRHGRRLRRPPETDRFRDRRRQARSRVRHSPGLRRSPPRRHAAALEGLAASDRERCRRDAAIRARLRVDVALRAALLPQAPAEARRGRGEPAPRARGGRARSVPARRRAARQLWRRGEPARAHDPRRGDELRAQEREPRVLGRGPPWQGGHGRRHLPGRRHELRAPDPLLRVPMGHGSHRRPGEHRRARLAACGLHGGLVAPGCAGDARQGQERLGRGADPLDLGPHAAPRRGLRRSGGLRDGVSRAGAGSRGGGEAQRKSSSSRTRATSTGSRRSTAWRSTGT